MVDSQILRYAENKMMIEDLNVVFRSELGIDVCLLDLDGTAISLTQFQADVRCMRDKIGTEEGAAWLLYCDDTYRFGVGLFSLLSLGKTVLISANSKPKWVQQFVSEFDAVLSDEELGFADKPLLDIDIGNATGGGGSAGNCIEFTGDESLIFFTSGSTGVAKAIRKPLKSLLNEIQTLEKFFAEWMQQSVVLASVSHHHIYGLLFKLLWPVVCRRLWLNTQIVYQEQLIAANAAIPQIVFASSPAFLSRLDVNLEPIDAAAVVSSGGPLGFSAAQESETLLGALPIEVYGSTETGGIAWRQQHSENCAWQLFDGMSLEQLGEGTLLSSPHIPQQQKWLLDDKLTLLDDGRFILKGRKDRIIKLEEKRVSLTEIERLAEALDSIQRCVAVPISGTREIIACVIELTSEGKQKLQTEGHKALIARWKLALAEHLDQITVPRKWRIVDKIPVNTQGKIDVAEIQGHFGTLSGDENKLGDGIAFPRVLRSSREINGFVLQLSITDELDAFDGHFDNSPVVPGVVQIKWAVGFARAYLQDVLPLGTEVLHSVKFQNTILPDCEVDLLIELKNDRLEFVFTSPAGRHSSGKMEFK